MEAGCARRKPASVSVTYEVTPRGAFFYAGPNMIMHSARDYDLINLAKQCLEGKLVLPNMGDDPIIVTNHPWLLRLSSELSGEAARMMETGRARKE